MARRERVCALPATGCREVPLKPALSQLTAVSFDQRSADGSQSAALAVVPMQCRLHPVRPRSREPHAIALSRSHTSFSGNPPIRSRQRPTPQRMSGASLEKINAPAITRDQHSSAVTTQPRRDLARSETRQQ
jgi:hypothetical protein